MNFKKRQKFMYLAKFRGTSGKYMYFYFVSQVPIAFIQNYFYILYAIF